MRSMIGALLLAAGGIAWLLTAIWKGLWTETVVCGSIAAGFVAISWGLRGTPNRGLIAAGFAVEALAAILPWIVYGTNGLDLGALWTALSILGFAAAAYATLRAPPGVVRACVAASIPFAVANVVQNEFAGHVNLWSPGNVLILAGVVWTALAWDLPAPEAATPAGA